MSETPNILRICLRFCSSGLFKSSLARCGVKTGSYYCAGPKELILFHCFMATHEKSERSDVLNSVEFRIYDQLYSLRGQEPETHLREVAEMIQRKVESLKKKNPSISLQKASMLVAFDLASDLIKGTKKSSDYRASLIAKTHQILERVELELESKSSF